MFPRLSFSSAALTTAVLAAALVQASTALFPGVLACLSGYGEANCSLLANEDLRCSVNRNGTRYEEAPNRLGYAYCTVRWEVHLTADGGVAGVTFNAYPKTLGLYQKRLLGDQGRLFYDCDNSSPYRSIVTTRCNTAGCCTESAEITIPKLCLYRKPRRPPKPMCYYCAGLFECSPSDLSCSLSSHKIATCSKLSNIYYTSGCSFTVLLFKSGEAIYYTTYNASLTEPVEEHCVASSFYTTSTFRAITCFCRGDLCNSGIMFQGKGTVHPPVDQFTAVTPRNSSA